MLKKLLFVSFFIALGPIAGSAQNLSAYHDYLDHFYVFDDGKSYHLEHLPVQNFQVGATSVAYLDNSGYFKLYHLGDTRELSRSVSHYHVTDNFVVYDSYSQLFVFDGRGKSFLSNAYSHYLAGDSIVAFYDDLKKYLAAFYKDSIYVLEDALVNDPADNFKVGDNIVAYIDSYDYLKAFYQGKEYELMLAERPVQYKCGRNIVGYINKSSLAFEAFYKAESYQLSAFSPESFQIADNRIAFVDQSGSFNLFDGGELYEVSPYAPEFYRLDDYILVFSENNYLKVYQNGQIYELENYIPSKYKIDYDKLVYLDQENHLKLFDNGVTRVISYEKVNSFDLVKNVLVFNTGVNTIKIYYRGDIY